MRVQWACLAAASLFVGLPAARAANANHPYSNVDRRVDAGNDTGDARVEQLNQAQLGQTQAFRRGAYGRPAPRGYRAYPAPGYGWPPSSYPPPGLYAPPPGWRG